MGKWVSAIALPVLALVGLLALFVIPIARLTLLAAGLGLAPLAVFYVVEGVVILVRTISPWRSFTWFKSSDAFTPDITLHAMGLELAVSVVATFLLVITGPFWQPLVHVDVPAWIVGFIALRAAGSGALLSFSKLRRPLAFVFVLLDLGAVLPIVALADGSLGGTVVISAFITWIFVLGCAWMPAMAKLPTRPRPPAPPEPTKVEPGDTDRWQPGSWIAAIESGVPRPMLAAVGGLAVMVPSIAAILLMSLMIAPASVAALDKPSKELGSRLARGIIVASFAVIFVYAVGPTLFRAVFPASFGDGSALHILAWTGVVFLPLALYSDPVSASQLRVGIGGLLALGLLFALAIGHGVDGVFWAMASAALIRSTLGTTNRDAKDPIVSI